MTNTVEPKASSSTPFFKSTSLTNIQTRSNTNSRVPILHGKQRKRSLTTFEVSLNTARKVDVSESLHDKNAITLVALKAFKKKNIPKEISPRSRKESNTIPYTCKNTLKESHQSSLDVIKTTNNTYVNLSADLLYSAGNAINNKYVESPSNSILTDNAKNSLLILGNKKEEIGDHFQVSTHPASSISSQIISSSKSLLKSMDTSKEEAKKRSVSLLQRTRSRKWSNPISDPKYLRYSLKNGPTAFMSSPAIPKCLEKNQKFLLMHRLLKSMTLGGYITDSLHVPMDIWYQPNVRLNCLEAKIAASELIIVVLEKMEAKSSIDIHLNTISSELKVLKQTLNQINETLKRMGCPVPEAIVIWSTKFTKSVEKMRLEATRSSTPNEEQNKLYAMTLIRLFTKAKTLEYWDSNLKAMVSKEDAYESLAKEVYKACSQCISHFMSIFCSLALKDCEILLSKWFKQSIIWIDE
ncbi:hypothetical protein BY458DRAFT_553892 [Sporodiniella umbellata]|nr:hypothetical protein BY458DRAFT_553892 [Sporodiniella umbellata]